MHTKNELLIKEAELVDAVMDLEELRNPDPWKLLEELLSYCNKWIGNDVSDARLIRERSRKALKWCRGVSDD